MGARFPSGLATVRSKAMGFVFPGRGCGAFSRKYPEAAGPRGLPRALRQRQRAAPGRFQAPPPPRAEGGGGRGRGRCAGPAAGRAAGLPPPAASPAARRAEAARRLRARARLAEGLARAGPPPRVGVARRAAAAAASYGTALGEGVRPGRSSVRPPVRARCACAACTSPAPPRSPRRLFRRPGRAGAAPEGRGLLLRLPRPPPPLISANSPPERGAAPARGRAPLARRPRLGAGEGGGGAAACRSRPAAQ